MSDPGSGGLTPPPLNLPGAQPITPGVQPGVSQAVIAANTVLVFGAAGGLFVYSGTPALGNPPIFWATSASVDPFGNVISSTAGVGGAGAFQAGNTITNPAGTFTYAGTPALGNLIISSASAAGTDSFGNAFLQGETAYQVAPNPNVAVGLNVGSITWYTATGPGGPWNKVAGFSLSGTAVQISTLNILSTLNVIASGGPFISGESFHVIANAAGVGGTLRVKLLPWNAVWIDLECTFAYTAAAQTFIMGSLPNAFYYPTVARRFPVSVTGTPSGITGTFPRLFVPTSGAVQIVVPSGTVASGINVSGSFMYPTN